jgi:ferrochelatase
MPRYQGRDRFAHGRAGRIGVLLCNLGTPSAPTVAAVRRYLAEFLSDPRVIEWPRWLWLPILHGVVLRLRPRRSAHAYARIWSERGSPLLDLSRRLTAALRAALQDAWGDELRIALGMRYGEPSIANAIGELLAADVDRLLVVPLFPQYSATTTAAVADAVSRTFGHLRWLPALRMVNGYYDEPGYIAALARSIRAYWQTHGKASHLLLSFHGLPRAYLVAGDPYYCHCQVSARLLAEALELQADSYSVAFQSRVGRGRWLEPYTDRSLVELAQRGVRRVDVVCPGFAADCLETLEEIALTNAELYRHAGGTELRYIPALNDSSEHVEFLCNLVTRELGGWSRRASDATALGASRERALKHGAQH